MTPAIISRVLDRAEFGVKLAQGPWQELAAGRIAVPVVGYMTGCLLGDYVLEPKGKEWVWVKSREAERPENTDPLAVRK